MNNHFIFKNILAFIFGGVFALGLMISGMSNPAKVQNFLDIFGTWDASLAFVMIGAILVVSFWAALALAALVAARMEEPADWLPAGEVSGRPT